jgi:CheY-like chemotaxis protein
VSKTTTFLQVEDDENDIFLVEQEFAAAPGHLRLKSVRDGIEARRYLLGEGQYCDRSKYPLPNVILLDLKMPRFSGFDFLEWLHSQSTGELRLIPVVVLSSSPLEEDVKRAYSLGVNSYMVKPVKWEIFRERIHTLGIYWSENVETPRIKEGRAKSE